LDNRYYALVGERIYVGGDDDPRRPYLVPDSSIYRAEGLGDSEGRESAAVATEPVTAVTIPDLEMHELYLTIREQPTHEVVTVIEVLSPGNKSPGTNSHATYVTKRETVLTTPTHLVEIDLLRDGKRFWPLASFRPADYLVHVSPAWLRPKGHVWQIRLQDRLPTIKIPLKTPEESVSLDLQAVLQTLYDRAGYNRIIDYTQPPDPPLTPEQAAWAKDIVAQAAGAKG
jgi:hypothetical protein